MPMTWPFMSNIGPPELPRLIDASVCRKSPSGPELMSRVAGVGVVEEIVEKLVERRSGGELGAPRGGPLGLTLRFHGLCRRDVDDRRQQLFGEVGKAIRCRPRHRRGISRRERQHQ